MLPPETTAGRSTDALSAVAERTELCGLLDGIARVLDTEMRAVTGLVRDELALLKECTYRTVDAIEILGR